MRGYSIGGLTVSITQVVHKLVLWLGSGHPRKLVMYYPDGARDLATSTYTVALLTKLEEMRSSEAVLPRLGTIVLLLVVWAGDDCAIHWAGGEHAPAGCS